MKSLQTLRKCWIAISSSIVQTDIRNQRSSHSPISYTPKESPHMKHGSNSTPTSDAASLHSRPISRHSTAWRPISLPVPPRQQRYIDYPLLQLYQHGSQTPTLTARFQVESSVICTWVIFSTQIIRKCCARLG